MKIDDWFDDFYLMLCELPDRTSPEDDPEAIVASREELRTCIEVAIQCAQERADLQ